MYISDFCANCLYEKQKEKVDNEDYLREVKEMLDHRTEADTAPYMVYRFGKLYESYFHKKDDYSEIKKKYNDFALLLEEQARKNITEADDPLKRAMLYARVGNYIDFGAMSSIDTEDFMKLFEKAQMSEADEETYASFLQACETGKEFLLLCDNCGEILFDKLMVEELKKRFQDLNVTILVRGGDVLNDATMEDACQVGMDQVAKVVSSGVAVAGTIYSMLSEEAKEVFDKADVILSKGQGNYESISHQGYHIFYAFLCKCELFTSRFQVPRLTGMFIEEKEENSRLARESSPT